MSLEALFRSISVVVQKFLSGLDVPLGDEDETRGFPEWDHLGSQIRNQTGMVDEAAQAPRLLRRINAKI
jgi:hypothetical protein